MPQFNISVPHYTTKEEATEKVKFLLEKLGDAYGNLIKDLKQDFTGDKLDFSFRTMGATVTGEGTVDDENVNVKGNLPITLMMFKGKIESDLKGSLEKLMKPKNA
ncbi:polyhydroxyalkanoic acid system family protein [Aeoliella sp.]|uniref:polyhydroxyalkanoic acid system family protein n=1 Tax=Aeoliella sp. TaxID=2795800 RepID=UPI003CCC2B94